MSTVINLVEDHNIYLCEGGPVYNGGVQPTPITYLTQWKIVGNSEVHTLPYPDGIILPDGYTRCKYLEFHGTEWIDTGIIPEQGIGVAMKFKYIKETGDDGIFGCYDSGLTEASFYCFRQRSNQKLFVNYGTDRICNGGTTGNFVINANDEIEFQLNSTSLSFTNGTDTFTKSVSSQITKGTKTLYIGAINGYGNKSRIILRTFVLTNGVGNTIFNGIPCLDDNGVPCLYDTVSGNTLYNQGTGTLGYEIEPQPTEIWSCGEYNATDGKWHILVQPQGGSIADIALDEPLRKVNDVADTIEFPSDTEGKALVTRNLGGDKLGNFTWNAASTSKSDSLIRWNTKSLKNVIGESSVILTIEYTKGSTWVRADKTYSYDSNDFFIYDVNYNTEDSYNDFIAHINNYDIIYELATPTTELVDAPQIEEADSYTCVISPDGKAVSWSSFETNSE